MLRSSAQLRSDALAIWQAGLDAVRSDQLVKENVCIDGDELLIGEAVAHALRVPLTAIRRIAVIGAGKAGAGMAAGLAEALGPRVMKEKQVSGSLNVPADCVPHIDNNNAIHLHAARPAGINEPTQEGVRGTERVLEIVSSLGPDDLCFCLISGGGSALLPAPVAGVTLAEKQAITRALSAGGANIQELNTVRKQLSRIKGGRLARACRAGHLVTLIISDVLGDPLDVIASGPTVIDTSTPQGALSILETYCDEAVAPVAFAYLRRVAAGGEANHGEPRTTEAFSKVTNLVIGNNAVAVDAAGMEAERRGYSHAMHAATSLEGPAEEIGIDLARIAIRMANEPGPDCLITGGEPTVKLAAPQIRGKGGRNQQLVLAALGELLRVPGSKFQVPSSSASTCNLELGTWNHLCLLSGGTDGEDGPTDAAGAFLDNEIIAQMRQQSLDAGAYLRRNDAYTFFDRTGGLIKTGPTHTNVCDVRVVVVDRIQSPPTSRVK